MLNVKLHRQSSVFGKIENSADEQKFVAAVFGPMLLNAFEHAQALRREDQIQRFVAHHWPANQVCAYLVRLALEEWQ